MRNVIFATLLTLNLSPAQGAALFGLPPLPTLDFDNNPIVSAIGNINNNIDGFFRGGTGGKGGQTTAAAAATTAAPAASAPPATSALNGQKGRGSSAAGATSAPANNAANSLFDPNMPTPAPPTAPAAFATGAPALTNAQQATSLSSACSAWVSDTGVVSNFQNIGSGLVGNTQQFKSQANIALLAEQDELLHKAVIDQIIGNDPTISLANLTLTDSSFQSVINGLQDMTSNGPARVADIAAINKVRCPQILPAIDTYCAIAAQFAAAQGVTFSSRAVRPSACTAVQQNTLSFSTNAPITPLPAAGGGGGGGAGAGNGGTAATATPAAGGGGGGGNKGGHHNKRPQFQRRSSWWI